MVEKHNNFMFRERPNPGAKIGFVVYYPFQFYPLKNIYAQFKDDAEFVVDHSIKEKIPDTAPEKTAQLLAKKGVYFRVLSKETHRSAQSLGKFFRQYRALISLTFTCCFWHEVNENRPKIRIEYGAGKDLSKFHPRQSKFDLLLLYGKRSAELSKFYTHSAIVGNTRFDDWFNDAVDKDYIKTLRTKLDSSKKTILYLPTHSELSSLEALENTLSGMRSKFNVLIKLHHLTVYHEPAILDSLLKKNFIVFDDTADSLPLYKIADVILGDNSSANFEALFFKKPLVITDFLDKEFFEAHRMRFGYYKSNVGAPQVYANSMEQQIKSKAAFRVKNPADLESALGQALWSPDVFSKERDEITKNVFSFNDGKCSLRAKEAIENFLSLKERPEKPVLYYVFDAFAEETRIKAITRVKNLPLLRKLKFIWSNFL